MNNTGKRWNSDINTFRKGLPLSFCAFIEDFSNIFAERTLSNTCNAGWNSNAGYFFTVSKRPSSNTDDSIRYDDIRHIFTLRKRTGSNTCNALGDCNTGQISTPPEGFLADAGIIAVNGNIGQLIAYIERMYDASAQKGTISSFPAHIGQLVYKSTSKTDAKKIHHVGVYIGDGYVIEAMGHEEGVVKTKLGGGGWTHWSQCPYIVDDTISTARSYTKDYEGRYTVTGKSVYIRANAGKSSKALGIVYKDAAVTCKGYFARVDGTVWLEVDTANGKGWMSTKYLKKV